MHSFCVRGFTTGWRISEEEEIATYGESSEGKEIITYAQIVIKTRKTQPLRISNQAGCTDESLWMCRPINTKRSTVPVFVVWLESVWYSSRDSKSILYWTCDFPKCAILVMWPEKVCYMANTEWAVRLIHPRKILHIFICTCTCMYKYKPTHYMVLNSMSTQLQHYKSWYSCKYNDLHKLLGNSFQCRILDFVHVLVHTNTHTLGLS